MDLFADEKVLLQSNEGSLQLTSHRIRLARRIGGHSETVSMTLDAVASCGLVTRAYPILVVVAGLFVVLGAMMGVRNEGGAAVFSLIVAGGAVVAYFISRSAVLEIRSAGGDRIQVAMKAKHDDVVPFIDAVENAKLALLESHQRAASVRAAG